MNTPTIQIDCPSCGTTYRLALPKVLVNKPNTPMPFRCNNCSYKFQIQPKEILEQPLVAKTLILVESDELKVHDNLQSVADGIESGQYGSEDLIRIHGQEWVMMGDEPTLSESFPKKEPGFRSAPRKTLDYFNNNEDPQIYEAVSEFLSNNKNSPVEKIFAKLDTEIQAKIANAITEYCKDNSTQPVDIEEALKPIIEKMLNEHYNH
tara:strand:+ start:1708 stop:2328 length:621 start_codon:yes stop_codon:yes gene_type:complete